MANPTLYLSPISMIVQYLTNLGLMAAGGQVYTYAAGTVSTLATTYTDSTGTTANPNPLTLSSTGRSVSASGAPIAFWTLPGVVLKLVVYDASGNLLVGPIDQISAINDLTNSNNSLQTALLNPAPGSGADLIANGIKSYDVFADLRGANVPNLATGQTLTVSVQGGLAVNDGLGGEFYWNASSVAADDGRTVIKLNASGSSGSGRFLRLYVASPGELLAYQATDQAVTSSTALVVASGLSVPVLGNAIYAFSLRLQFAGVGATGQGYKVSPVCPVVAVSPPLGGVLSSNGTAAVVLLQLNAVNAQTAVAAAAPYDFVNIDGIVTTNAAGTFSLQFAQNSSSANSTVLKAGSSVMVKRIA